MMRRKNMPTAKDLVQEIEKLSPAERVRLIDKVVRDTIKPDVEIEGICGGGDAGDLLNKLFDLIGG
jgi:hypothetical protein